MPATAAARSTCSAYSAKLSAYSCCGPSQIASSGCGCTSTMIPSAPAAAAASDSGVDEVAAAGGVARVDDHRQVRELLQHRHRGEVEREAVGGLEGADPALAQQHVRVALLEHVLGRHQQLLERRGQPALDQHRLAGAADLGQQRVVLHVAGADLDDVGDLDHGLEVARVHQLGDDRQAGLRLGLLEQPQALLAEALERVRRGARLVGAAAEQRGAGGRHGAGGGERLVARLDRARPGDEREVLTADLSSLDVDHRSLAVADLRRGELVRLEDRHDLGDARSTLEAEARHVLAVADRADHGDLLAARGVGAGADRLDPVDDGLDLRFRRPRLHHDHHLLLLLTRLHTLRTIRSSGARPEGPDFERCEVRTGRAPS